MQIAVMIVERRGRILLAESQGKLFLPGGMLASGESETDCLRRKVMEVTGKAVANIYGKVEKAFSGISPRMKCGIEASVFVGDIACKKISELERERGLSLISKESVLMFSLSDVARSALEYYLADNRGK